MSQGDETCSCAEFKQAQEAGTDHELYGAAITKLEFGILRPEII